MSNFFKAVSFVLRNGASTVLYDSLTELYGLKIFKEFALKTLKLASRKNISVCLVMADLNSFKQLNDKFGHLRGDRALKEVAEVFKKHTRETDIVGRYGGDEFIILLPGTSLSDSFKIIEKIKSSLPETGISCSFGIAEAKFPDSSWLRQNSSATQFWEKFLTDLISKADKLLYKDKRSAKVG
ncbi:MAG: GGDEF domain-containing protein [Candidatus Colwellbacteria bacterium]|nr:GGDEF domain-containing protein [Candidatus Colwellbacteria bacterium]